LGSSKNNYLGDFWDMCYIRNEGCVSCAVGINSTIVFCSEVKSRYAVTYTATGMGTHTLPNTEENRRMVQYLMMHTFDVVDRRSSLCRDCYMRSYGNPAESAYMSYRANMDSWMLPERRM
jgi:hypothetical protein